MNPEPNFERLRKVLLCQEPDRVPLVELHIDQEFKESFLGKPVKDISVDVEFWYKAGYDYIYIRANYEYQMPGRLDPSDPVRLYKGEMQERGGWAEEGKGLISNEEEFEKYPWFNSKEIDYSTIDDACRQTPFGMKVISGVGGIFTRVWRIMGFETFSIALFENPKLVEKMFRRIGNIQLGVYKHIVGYENIGAMWYGDDLAYTEGLMVSPAIFRKCLFPYLEEMGNICKKHNLPFIIHSDGNLW